MYVCSICMCVGFLSSTSLRDLVAVGHMTTQNLGGKKSVGREGWQSVLIVAVTNVLGFCDGTEGPLFSPKFFTAQL